MTTPARLAYETPYAYEDPDVLALFRWGFECGAQGVMARAANMLVSERDAARLRRERELGRLKRRMKRR